MSLVETGYPHKALTVIQQTQMLPFSPNITKQLVRTFATLVMALILPVNDGDPSHTTLQHTALLEAYLLSSTCRNVSPSGVSL